MGLLRDANGDEYLGLFEKNKRCGRGTFVVSQGIMYRAVFAVCNDGRVVCFHAGFRYCGAWEDDVAHDLVCQVS